MGTGTLVNLLILLAVLAIVVVAGYFILSQIQLPPPIQKIILILLVAVVAIIAIIILLNLGGVTHIGTRSHALLGEHYSQVAPLPPVPPGPPPICQGC